MSSDRAIDPELIEDIPPGLVEFVRTLVRANWMAERVLVRASAKVLRRLKPHPEADRNAAARRARWATRWHPENRTQTMKWLGQVRDRIVREHHQASVAQHDTFSVLPEDLEPWEPNAEGVLVVDEPQATTPSFGSAAFLEATPLQVLRWVHETWRGRQSGEEEIDLGLDWALNPAVWDVTAGSATSVDYFHRLHGCAVIASDLTVVGGDGVEPCDARRFDTLNGRRQRRRGDLTYSTVVVSTPDIILVDPPSRGLPLHSQVYANVPNDFDPRDLGLLEREEWIATVADLASRATARLADGGFTSLLLRCGFRFHDEVVSEPDLLVDFKSALAPSVVVAHEMPLHYRAVRNQTVLGTSRVPAVHLTLRKAQ